MNFFTPFLTKPNLFFYEKKCNTLLLLHESKIALNKVNASEPTLKILNSNIQKLKFSKKKQKEKDGPNHPFLT